MPQCNRSIVILRRKLLWIFGKRFIYENLEKIKSFHKQTYLCNVGATDILNFYENLFKTLPTIGNEKE